MPIIVKFFIAGKGFVKKHLCKKYEIVYNDSERYIFPHMGGEYENEQIVKF